MYKTNSIAINLATIILLSLSLSACFDDNDNTQELDNSPPQALSVSLSTQAETDIESSLPASDPDNDPLVFSVIVEPTFGSLILNSDGSYIYKPSAEFTGTDSFTYAVSDGQVSNVSGTINIVITPLNVSFLEQSRLAFGQREDATPVSVNGRLFTQDVSGTSDYQDLIDANAN